MFYVIFLMVMAPVILLLVSYTAASAFTIRTRAVVQIPNDLNAEAVEFRSLSDSVIHGSWIAGSPAAPTILLLHGIWANRNVLVHRAELFKRLGYNVLFFDFQGHAESTGKRITFGLKESFDVAAAMQWIRARLPQTKIGAIGISMGGAATLIGVDMIDADVLVLESVYPTLFNAIDDRVWRWAGPLSRIISPLFLWQLDRRFGIKGDDLQPIKKVAQYHNPILILSGASDLHTTAKETRALFAAANEPKHLELFEGAGHVDLFDYEPEKYEAIVIKFFKSYLS